MEFPFSALSPTIARFLERYGVGPDCGISLAGVAGSRRLYYRLSQGPATFIVLVSPSDDQDFGRFLRITQFYRLLDFPVPRVYCIDDPAHQVVLEDLGNERLYDAALARPGEAPAAYQRVLQCLLDLQSRCSQRHQECPDIFSRVFGMEDLLWESGYYYAQYLRGHRGLDLPAEPAGAFRAAALDLAAKVDLQPKAIMHRDFQSQNIMIQAGGAVRIIDFQGSRLGSVYYDLASLLLDPYMGLADDLILELLRYWHAKALVQLPFPEMLEHFLLAGCQRVMQALGAYCFLSRVKGIADFAAHIGPGERRLAWVADQLGRLGAPVDMAALMPAGPPVPPPIS